MRHTVCAAISHLAKGGRADRGNGDNDGSVLTVSATGFIMCRMDRRNGASATSIRDVARLANVSAATVSRAFAEPGLVRQETLRRGLPPGRGVRYPPARAPRALD